jgi:hypothetical protein
MSATTVMKLHDVQVYKNKNGHSDVIGLVRWAVEFQKGSFVSRAVVETLLDTSNLNNFVPITQVTREQVLSWALAAQGGEEFVEQHLRPHHEADLETQEHRSGLTVYAGIATDAWPVNVPKSTIPQQVL